MSRLSGRVDVARIVEAVFVGTALPIHLARLPMPSKPNGPGTDRPGHSGEVAMRRFYTSLFGQVLAALVLGIVLGLVWPSFAVALKPLGTPSSS